MATILIADDDAHIRQLLRLTLAGNGHEMLEAADGDTALTALRAHRPAADGAHPATVPRRVDAGAIVLSQHAPDIDAH